MLKTILTAGLILGTASFAVASESDANLLNRYPGANMTQGFSAPALTTRNVALGGQFVSTIDRAAGISGGGY